MNAILPIIILVIGIVLGVVICRYGIGLGAKIIYQVKEDMPLGERAKPISQVNTDGTEDNEEG